MDRSGKRFVCELIETALVDLEAERLEPKLSKKANSKKPSK
jgi:hypothetical protein